MTSTAHGTPQASFLVRISLPTRILRRSTTLYPFYGATTSIPRMWSWDLGSTVVHSPSRTQAARLLGVYSPPEANPENAHSQLAHCLMPKLNASSPAAP